MNTPAAPRTALSTPDDPHFVSGAEALRILGVKRSTLYTYVSRGWVRSIPLPTGRKHLFAREDIERMRTRSQARAGNAARAETAMRFGDPVITTRITEITAEGPRYRGRPALDLAKSGCSFEAVALLLWTGGWVDEHLRWSTNPADLRPDELARLIGSASSEEITKFLASTVLAAGMRMNARLEHERGTTLELARQLIQMMIGCLGMLSRRGRYHAVTPGEPIAVAAAKALGIAPTEEACHAIDALMILCADYELTPANFTARVVASAGGDMTACVAAGLCAHSGTFTGQMCDKLEELLLVNATRQTLQRKLDTVRRYGVKVYGFNHPLYPKGDPRAYWMIELARSLRTGGKVAQNAIWFLDQVREDCGMYPGLQTGLIALQLALGLPQRSTVALWAIARTAGQIAHVIEQRQADFVLRPRARFIGG